MTIHIVVSCVKNKILKGVSISDIKPDNISNIYKNWKNLINNEYNSSKLIKSMELYKGITWNINLSILKNLKDFDKKFWIISAGYGFLDSNTNVIAYQSTFQNGEEDSISNVILNENKNIHINREWWKKLITSPILKQDITSIKTLLESSKENDKFIFILSKMYLDAVNDDLIEGLKTKKINDCLIISNSKELNSENYKKIFPQLLNYIEGASETFKCSLINLNNKIALELVKDVYNKFGWDIKKFNDWANLKSKKVEKKDLKKTLTDKEIREFIISNINNDIIPSKTSILKKLRESGFACEQKRFQKIYSLILA